MLSGLIFGGTERNGHLFFTASICNSFWTQNWCFLVLNTIT